MDKTMDVVSLGETLVSFTPNQMGFMRNNATYKAKIAGAETNTLIGLSRLGHRVGWMSKLGNDEFGHLILNTVRGEGVDTNEVTLLDEEPTGIFFKEIIHGAKVRVTYYRKGSAASYLSAQDLNPTYIKKAKYLYLSGITPALSQSCREALFTAIRIAKESATKIVFDPNLRKKLWGEEEARKTLLEIISLADIVLPGINEAKFLLDTDNPDKVASQLLEKGPSLIVMKLGEKGAFYATSDQSGTIPAFPVERVIDPVGAGDGFAAGLLSGLLNQEPLPQAVQKACAIGAMVTMINGDFEGLPDQSLLTEFMFADQQDDVNR